MVSTTIEVRGPKRLIRRVYALAKQEHERGLPFCGLFDEATRAKVEGEHALRLSRFGYLPLGAARRELAPVLDAVAAEEGVPSASAVVHLQASSRGGFAGLLPF